MSNNENIWLQYSCKPLTSSNVLWTDVGCNVNVMIVRHIRCTKCIVHVTMSSCHICIAFNVATSSHQQSIG